MATIEGFRWDQYGKADYATVGKWFRLFPSEFRNQLNRSEEETFIWTLFFAWFNGQQAGRATNYASFSQEKTAEKFGRSRWTCARALD